MSSQTPDPLRSLQGLTWLLLCQSAGEALARLTHAPLPGPVIGLLLLVVLLQLPAVRPAIAAAADGLLAHLSLLFVPVGVGVITHVDLIARYGARMAVALIASTWIGLAVTALLLRAWLPKAAARDAAKDAA